MRRFSLVRVSVVMSDGPPIGGERPPQVGKTPKGRRGPRWLCMFAASSAILVAACTGTPSFIVDREPLPSCNRTEHTIYLPAQQGPDADEEASERAVACMLDRWQEREPAELVFVLVGLEGDRYDALLQIADGEASLLREGHDPSVGCRSLGLADPGIFELKDCSDAPGNIASLRERGGDVIIFNNSTNAGVAGEPGGRRTTGPMPKK